MNNKGSKVSFLLGASCLACYASLLVFRAVIYPDMHIAPDDPYGPSDIIELFISTIMFLLIFTSVLTSVILLVRSNAQNKKPAIILLVVCAAIFLSYSPLHELAANWGL